MSHQNLVMPQMHVLTTEQMAQVHAHSLAILAKAGILVDSPQAIDLLADRIGPSSVQGSRVYMPPEIVEWALSVAPNTIDLYSRTGDHAFRLGEGRARYGIGVTNLYYQEPETDNVLPFARSHMETSVRLGHTLPQYDLISTVGILQDLPPEVADLYAVLEMIANTTKPLVILISEPALFDPALDLLEHLTGDLASRPFVIPYLNPITPLVVNRDTADKLFATIDRGLPVIYSNYGMAGMSTPITPAGTLALLNAELLAGLVLSQVYKEGTPVILGSLPAYFDMKEMVDIYDPMTILLNAACAEMMDFYHLPHAGTSGSGAGWGPDIPEMGIMWLNHLTSGIGKAGLAPFVGSTLGSKAFSPATAVYAHEIIEQARRFAGGFILDDDMTGLDEMIQEGPGGSFLGTDLTIQHFRQAYHQSAIFPHYSLEKWQAQGRPDAGAHLREYTRDLLQSLQQPDDHAEMVAKGTGFISTLTGS